ncbi:43kDa postsynaptic protein [Parasponia andersonii]|uniref:RING-type E3 ubiquitin transferase n=1 Tax=Parasponia andersonii TaxID=3476 RepID=A0A2P5DAE1_PARAD|nr:43kDa postsynaptic protein [Parasponia andersonii]
MNNNPLSPNDDASSNLGGFRYGIGVSVGVLILIIFITLFSCICTLRTRLSNHPNRPAALVVVTTSSELQAEQGLDDAVLGTFPKISYGQAKLHMNKGSDGHDRSTCSICLADYNDSDMLRLLPDCGHVFHLTCVDPWLRQHPTCPICRNSPIPTPSTTPLAEVAPFAGRRE